MQKLLVHVGLCFVFVVLAASFSILFIPRKQAQFICPEAGLVATTPTGSFNILIVPDFNADLKDQFFTMAKYFKNKKQTFVISEDMDIRGLLKKQEFDCIVLYGTACSLINTLDVATKISLFCPGGTLIDDIEQKNINKIYLKYYDENGNNFIWENYLKNTKKIVYIR